MALRRSYCRPQIEDGAEITIAAGRHPVVEETLDEPFVPNDAQLSPGRADPCVDRAEYVGQVDLSAADGVDHADGASRLVRAGGPRPASGVVDRIFTRIGASDELHRGQSTFMVEMIETANILNHATERSLLILDEIGRGTSTYDGLAIAWAVIEHIHNAPALRAKTLFATHYHELTELGGEAAQVVNYHVAVDDSGEEVVFLRRILPGKADRSYGVHGGADGGPAAGGRAAGGEEILFDLEASGAAGPATLLDLAPGRKQKAAMQVGLFASEHPAVESLRSLEGRCAVAAGCAQPAV